MYNKKYAYVCAYNTAVSDCFDSSWGGVFCAQEDGEVGQAAVGSI